MNNQGTNNNEGKGLEGLHRAPVWKALGRGIGGVPSHVPCETPVPAPVVDCDGLRPELHFMLAHGDHSFRIQTNDGAIRTFVALGGVVKNLPITVYYDPVDEDACEVFHAVSATVRECCIARLPLGCGVLAALERRDGSRETDLVLPASLREDAWCPLITCPGLHYAKDADGRIALGYEMKASSFQVINGPQDIVPVLFQPACPRGSRALGRLQGKGGAE